MKMLNMQERLMNRGLWLQAFKQKIGGMLVLCNNLCNIQWLNEASLQEYVAKEETYALCLTKQPPAGW